MIKVFTTGTFDILHYGHLRLLQRARSYGDYLCVGLNVNPKGKTPYYSYEIRKEFLLALKCVDKVVPIEKQEDKYYWINELDIDKFVIGNDYAGFGDLEQIKHNLKDPDGLIVIDRTPNISTTQVKSDNTLFKTIVLDIDDTICTVKNRDFLNGEPHNEIIDKVNSLYDQGWKIIFATARGSKTCQTLEQREEKYRKITETWLKNNGVKYHELLFGKPDADYYVDDKNMSIIEFLNF